MKIEITRINKKKIYSLIFLFFLFVFFIQYFVYAHLDVGTDKEVNGYIIDFGYSPKIPKVNEEVLISLNIINVTTNENVNADAAWVRISTVDKIIFSGILKPENGKTVFSFNFKEPNIYNISVKFEKDDKTIAATSFNLAVIKSSKANEIKYGLGWKITYIFGLINIIALVLILLSCKCIVSFNFIRRMLKYDWYKKFYSWHCYYWYIFITSVILHIIFALLTFGNPFK